MCQMIMMVVEKSCCAECITSIPYDGCASPWIQTNEPSIWVAETFSSYHLHYYKMNFPKRRSQPFDRTSPTREMQSNNNAVHQMPVVITSQSVHLCVLHLSAPPKSEDGSWMGVCSAATPPRGSCQGFLLHYN